MVEDMKTEALGISVGVKSLEVTSRRFLEVHFGAVHKGRHEVFVV
jgi:hypothetical protein